MGKLKKFLLFEQHVCPWWLAYSWDHRLRKLIHNPEKILKPYLSEGDIVADVGCGMGFFSIAAAKYVGSSGRVFSVDVQQKMLDILQKRAQYSKYTLPITSILADRVHQMITDPIDFLLNFWMLHEVNDKTEFLNYWHRQLKQGGKYLLVEPKIHTSRKSFEEEIGLCESVGFEEIEKPIIRTSRAVLFRKV